MTTDLMSRVLAVCHINKCHVGINADVALRWQIHTQNPILTAIQPTRPQTHQITNHALIILINIPTINMCESFTKCHSEKYIYILESKIQHHT